MTHANAKHEVDLKESVTAVKDAVTDLAGDTGRYARQRVSEAKESAAAMIDTVKGKAEGCNDNVVGFIRENPYSAVAIAAGIGLAAGFLLRRR